MKNAALGLGSPPLLEDCCAAKLTRRIMTSQSAFRFIKRHLASSVVSGALLIVPAAVPAQVAGSTVIGVAAAEMREVAVGWSAKRQILGKSVFNDNNQRIGAIDDIIIAPDRAVSYAIIGAGGFLGVARHDVAIPVSQLKLKDGRIVLPGATKQALKEAPEFEYASHKE
jgi:PRC-barrel domain